MHVYALAWIDIYMCIITYIYIHTYEWAARQKCMSLRAF